MLLRGGQVIFFVVYMLDLREYIHYIHLLFMYSRVTGTVGESLVRPVSLC